MVIWGDLAEIWGDACRMFLSVIACETHVEPESTSFSFTTTFIA